MRQITSSLDFLPWKWILWQKKMNARDVYFSAQGLKDLFPDPLIWRERQIKVGLARVDDISWRGWWRSGLALHSRPVFRDGFLLAYTMWCCTILPSRFQFKFEKMKPQWTSKRSVPTLTGEGINTHTQEGRNTSLVPPELKNKHRVRSFFHQKNPFIGSKI